MTLEREQAVKIKTLLMKCYIAEANLAVFLMRATETCNPNLDLDDLLRLKDMSAKINGMLAEIEASDASGHNDSSDDKRPSDKATVYPMGGSTYVE